MTKKVKRPNILYIFSDQQRSDTLGCYGQNLAVTPNLDKLAGAGVVFNNAFSVQPLCGPARSCMQTGRYATQNGCHINGLPLKESPDNLGSLLSATGYKTGYIGKWHLAAIPEENEHFLESPVPVNMRGGYKDRWIVSNILEITSDSNQGYLFDDNKKVFFEKYRVDAITDYALDFIDDFADEPFFLTVSYLEPHHQNSTDTHESPGNRESLFKDFKVPPDLLPGEGNWEKEYSKYLACCNSIDENVKRLLDKLEERGIRQDTVIIYSSDHGSHFKTRPGTYKRSCHESSIKVPLIINGGPFNTGKKASGLATIMDIPVTIMKLAGLTPPEDVFGFDLSEYANDENAKIRDDVFIQISEIEVGRAIRTDRYKMHVTSCDGSGPLNAHAVKYKYVYLYDLEKDPGEHLNLIDNPVYKGVIKDLTIRIKKHILDVEGINAKIVKI